MNNRKTLFTLAGALAVMAPLLACGGQTGPDTKEPEASPPAKERGNTQSGSMPASPGETATPPAPAPASLPGSKPEEAAALPGSKPEEPARAEDAGADMDTDMAPGLSGAVSAVDAQGRRVVAGMSGQSVAVRVWDGNGWIPLGQGDEPALLVSSLGWVSELALGIDPRGGLLLAWVDWDRRRPRLRLVRIDAERRAARDASPRQNPALACPEWSVEFGMLSEPPALHIDKRGHVYAACVGARILGKAPNIMPSGGPPAQATIQVHRYDGRWKSLPEHRVGKVAALGAALGRVGMRLASAGDGGGLAVQYRYQPDAASEHGAQPEEVELIWDESRQRWRSRSP